MATMEEHLKRVNTKLQQVLKQYQFLQKENETLKLKAAELQAGKQKDAEEISRLQHQVSILKSSLGQMAEADKKIFEKQINHYIKEIDKCISLLSE